jgi:hypothetical protein
MGAFVANSASLGSSFFVFGSLLAENAFMANNAHSNIGLSHSSGRARHAAPPERRQV